jgi:hypothetical protein
MLPDFGEAAITEGAVCLAQVRSRAAEHADRPAGAT